MNSFFASVEQLDNACYRGKPVGVVPIMTDFTSFIAASPEAKRLGVRMGISVRQARQQFPDLIIVKARPQRYVEIHHKVLRACDKHAPPTKTYSIDEWSIRLAPVEQSPAAAIDLAKRIKRQIVVDVQGPLSCSAGIAPTRLLSKIACDLQKPDGLTILTSADLPGRLAALQLDDLPGMSHGVMVRLNKNGIDTIDKLWQMTQTQARQVWGSVIGEHWWYGFHGIDMPEIETHRSSMGHSNVLEPKFRNDHAAYGIMVRLACKLAMRLRYHGYFANHLSAWVRHECGRTWADDIALPCLQDTPTILQQLEKIWQRRQKMLAELHYHGRIGRPKKNRG